MNTENLPNWLTFPGDDWAKISPEQAGLDTHRFASFLEELQVHGASFGGEDHTGNKWGALITRGGYLIHSWGNILYRFQTASTGKAFTRVLLGYAVEDGLLDPNQPIHRTWTGEGQLSHPHKYLDQGHHQTLTWSHLAGPRDSRVQYGGFPIEMGVRWNERRSGLEDHTAIPGVPEWANWTGDAYYDTYSHVEPGTVGLYSSAGFWRLGQALTALWGKDLKDVLDDRLFSKIGITADSWDWPTGRKMTESKYFYPSVPDAYTYLDPPYEIGGHPVRSGPGWVIINASDLARFGHLVSTNGIWEGKQLIGPNWLRGHGGGNNSGVSGEGIHYTSMAVVATSGLAYQHGVAKESFLPPDLFIGPVKV